MRFPKMLIVVPVLALLALGCAPRRPGGPGGSQGRPPIAMAQSCSTDGCVYKGRCFSNGAVSSNDGVCQACSNGRWVEASGCVDQGPCGAPGCWGHHGWGGGPGSCPYCPYAKGKDAKDGKAAPAGRDATPPCHKR